MRFRGRMEESESEGIFVCPTYEWNEEEKERDIRLVKIKTESDMNRNK